eukprot:Em0001g226a
MAGLPPLGSFPPHTEAPSAKRKRRSHSRASQEAFIDLGSGDDTDSTVMEEGQTPRAPSLSTTVVAAVESVSCPPGAAAAATPVLAQVTTPAQTPVLPGKNSALVSVHINAVGFMQQHFKDLLDNKKYVDVTFVVEGQPVPAHRLILASQSDYFDRLFYGKMREANSSDEIPLPNAPLEAFRLLLEFMYSGCLDYDNQPLQVVLDLLSLADSYMVGMLKEALSHQLCEHIDLDSVLPILLHASVHSVSLLNEKCLQFVDHHAKEVLTGPSFLPLPKECVLAILSRDSLYVPEEEIFQAVTRWMDHNHHNKEDIKDIIACVRLSEISPSVLFALVEPSGFFDGQCILDALRIQMKPELLEMRSRGRLGTLCCYGSCKLNWCDWSVVFVGWSKFGEKLTDFQQPENRDKAVQCLNHLITNALQHIPDVLDVVKIRKGQAVDLIMQSTNMASVETIFAHFAEEVKKLCPHGNNPSSHRASLVGVVTIASLSAVLYAYWNNYHL